MTNSPPSSEFYRPRLVKAAAAGHLFVCKCILCRRSVMYLDRPGRDLPPGLFISDLFGGRCPRCGSVTGWSVRERIPSGSDVGMLQVRRPAGYWRIQLWQDERFSAPAPKD